MAADHTRLGDQATLTKIDKLRELNVGMKIPLLQVRSEDFGLTIRFFFILFQILVISDQFFGKSFLLESLTRFFFSKVFGFCIRYVTQTICCRNA